MLLSWSALFAGRAGSRWNLSPAALENDSVSCWGRYAPGQHPLSSRHPYALVDWAVSCSTLALHARNDDPLDEVALQEEEQQQERQHGHQGGGHQQVERPATV